MTQLQSLFPNPCQLKKPSVQLLSSSVLIHHQSRSVKLTSTVMWWGLQRLPKMTWMTRLLSSCMGVARLSSLRPGYQPPSRQAVSSKLLDKCHDKYQAIMKQLLNNMTVTMKQDGWSSCKNDPVIATSVVSAGKATLWMPRTQIPPTRLQRPVRLWV